MTSSVTRVQDASSFQQALTDGAQLIEVAAAISGLPRLELPAGTHLRGAGENPGLTFKAGSAGLRLTADHRISGLSLKTDPDQIAVGLTDQAQDLGTIELSQLRLEGRLHLEAVQALNGQLRLSDIHVDRADARDAGHRPAGYGVHVRLGGISVYNRSTDPASRWQLEARNLSGGRQDAPLRGSGVFIFGGATIPEGADPETTPAPTQAGGRIELALLTTGEIHSDGGIPAGTPDQITGGVFVGCGVEAGQVVNHGPVTTYNVNDMVLDNWGSVHVWVAEQPVVSHGDSGIGFVNFGTLQALIVKDRLETHGNGARGYNLYDGFLDHAEFQSITTYGNGSVGVQLSKPFGRLIVLGDLRTRGGAGPSLVRGRVLQLKANALSLEPGVQGQDIVVLGEVVAEQEDVPSFDFAAPASTVGLIMANGQIVQ